MEIKPGMKVKDINPYWACCDETYVSATANGKIWEIGCPKHGFRKL